MPLFSSISMPHNCLFLQPGVLFCHYCPGKSWARSLMRSSSFFTLCFQLCFFIAVFLASFFFRTIKIYCSPPKWIIKKKSITYGGHLPWRHWSVMWCHLQNDNGLTTKGKKTPPEEGRTCGSSRAVFVTLLKISSASEGTTHLEHRKFRKLWKSQSELTLFPERCLSWFSFQPFGVYRSAPTFRKKKVTE